jgi:hypothetical protein
MKGHVAVFACLVLVCSTCSADSWALKPEEKDSEYVFGSTRVVLHYDSTQDRSFPKYRLSIYADEKLVGQHEGVGFEQLFASPDNTYFLGVSNRGLIQHAYVVFDHKGRILKKQPHDLREVHYFSMSKTLIRKWCHAEKPDPRFTVVGKELKGIRISACDGSRIALMIGGDFGLQTFLLERLLQKHAQPEENCYVSFGRELPAAEGGTTRCDPPKQFLRLFEKRPYRVKPVSAYPKPNGAEPWPKDNPQTGNPDGIYTVEIVQWLDKDTAEVRIDMFRHGLWARGEQLVVERRDGEWSVKERGEVWAS